MDPDGNLLVYLICLIALILLTAVFTLGQVSMVSLSDGRLKKGAEEGHRRFSLIARLLDPPSRFLAANQIGLTFFSLLTATLTAYRFGGLLSGALTFLPLGKTALDLISLVLLTLILCLVVMTFGILLPNRIAAQHPEKVAFAVAPLLWLLLRLSTPFNAMVTGCASGLIRLFGMNPHQEPEAVTEEEIRMMVDVGEEKGVIEQSEKDMINNIFEFDDRTAGEIMTHRTEMSAVENTATIEEVVQLAIEEGYSRIPVYEEDLDNIIGIIYVKDLLCLIGRQPEEKPFNLKDYMRQALYVPESNRCTDLFRQFKEKKIQMAIVIDEYGGTSGLVTMEDVLESIVGKIQDEYDAEDDEISKLSENIYMLDGSIMLEEVERLLDIEIPENDDYDTLGGLITDILGRIPQPGEHPSVEISGIQFTVMVVEDRRIAQVRAERPAAEPNVPPQEN